MENLEQQALLRAKLRSTRPKPLYLALGEYDKDKYTKLDYEITAPSELVANTSFKLQQIEYFGGELCFFSDGNTYYGYNEAGKEFKEMQIAEPGIRFLACHKGFLYYIFNDVLYRVNFTGKETLEMPYGALNPFDIPADRKIILDLPNIYGYNGQNITRLNLDTLKVTEYEMPGYIYFTLCKMGSKIFYYGMNKGSGDNVYLSLFSFDVDTKTRTEHTAFSPSAQHPLGVIIQNAFVTHGKLYGAKIRDGNTPANDLIYDVQANKITFLDTKISKATDDDDKEWFLQYNGFLYHAMDLLNKADSANRIKRITKEQPWVRAFSFLTKK